MEYQKLKSSNLNRIWNRIGEEAQDIISTQNKMSSFIYSCVLNHKNIQSVISYRLAQKLSTIDMSESTINQVALDCFVEDEKLIDCVYSDLIAVLDRDPACNRYLQPILYFKGFLALQAYRVSNYLFAKNNQDLAYFLQMRSSEVFSVDIHPGAKLGKGIMIDHAHAIVIGETAVVGDDVSMLHSVTLGGTGKEKGDRHPKIGDGVLIGAGASILGNIKVGRCSRIASGSVVLTDVPDCKTVAGVPAKIVGEAGCGQPSTLMNHNLD